MKINISLSLIAAAASTLLLCQCAANRVPELKPGEAYFDASPASKHRAGLTGFSIVSVNGKKTKGSATRVPSGPVKAVVEFHWPKSGKKKVPLDFNARDGHSYFVKYDRYPNLGSSSRNLGGVSTGLLATGSQLHILGLPLIGAGILTGFVGSISEGAGLKIRSTKAADFIELSVISTLTSEGVRLKVKTYSPGSNNKR